MFPESNYIVVYILFDSIAHFKHVFKSVRILKQKSKPSNMKMYSCGKDGKCKNDKECVVGGICHIQSKMCICQNGASSYPSCITIEGNSCKRKCSPLQYCDGRSNQCVCKHGGMSEESCCSKPCGRFRVCNEGRCKCAYGTKIRGRCRKCMEKCLKTERCVKIKKGNLNYQGL